MTSLTSTAGIIPWIVICVTYHFFKKDLKNNNMVHSLEPKSRSYLQPVLSWYGGVMTFILGTNWCFLWTDFCIVILQGFQAWKWDSLEAKYAMASWSIIFSFILLVCGLSIQRGTNPFSRWGLSIEQETDGEPSPLGPPDNTISSWKRVLNDFLDSL